MKFKDADFLEGKVWEGCCRVEWSLGCQGRWKIRQLKNLISPGNEGWRAINVRNENDLWYEGVGARGTLEAYHKLMNYQYIQDGEWEVDTENGASLLGARILRLKNLWPAVEKTKKSFCIFRIVVMNLKCCMEFIACLFPVIYEHPT